MCFKYILTLRAIHLIDLSNNETIAFQDHNDTRYCSLVVEPKDMVNPISQAANTANPKGPSSHFGSNTSNVRLITSLISNTMMMLVIYDPLNVVIES